MDHFRDDKEALEEMKEKWLQQTIKQDLENRFSYGDRIKEIEIDISESIGRLRTAHKSNVRDFINTKG